MIYLDPPYGIKFGSNWQVSTRKRDVKDGKAEDVTRQPEQIKAFRDTWELGIHSYLTYLRDRLIVARDLLTETRQHLRPDRRRERPPRAERAGRGLRQRELREPDHVQQDHGCRLPRSLARACDYLLWYAQDVERLKYRQLCRAGARRSRVERLYAGSNCPMAARRRMTADEQRGEASSLPRARVSSTGATLHRHRGARTRAPSQFKFEGRRLPPGASAHWKTRSRRHAAAWMRRAVSHVLGNSIRVRPLSRRLPAITSLTNLWDDTGTAASPTTRSTSSRPTPRSSSAACS